MKTIWITTFLWIAVTVGNAFGASLDLSGWTDITIWDRMGGSQTLTPGNAADTRQASDPRDNLAYDVNEDDEAEPGASGSQQSDLEGVFLNGNQLALVGGYDFMGIEGEWANSAPGDVFVSLDTRFDNPAFRSNRFAEGTAGSRGYEYALDIDYGTRTDPGTYTYDVVWLGYGSPVTADTTERIGSSPWSLLSGGLVFSSGNPVAFYDAVSGVGFQGERRYALVLDLAALGFAKGLPVNIYTHFTMQNGADSLKGYSGYTPKLPPPIPSPEPTTLLLMGFGLIGLSGILRRGLTRLKR